MARVNFKYSSVYDGAFYRALNFKKSDKLFDFVPAKENAIKHIAELEGLWRPLEPAILGGIESITGIKWKGGIDCQVVNYAVSAFSEPIPTLTTRLGYQTPVTPQENVHILTHELSHDNLSSGNPKVRREHFNSVKETYQETNLATSHILVHSILIELSKAVGDWLLEMELKTVGPNKPENDYWRSMQIAQRDYEKILTGMRALHLSF